MSENIIWTVEGTIKDGEREAFDAVMRDMIGAVEKEEGTLNYEWTLGGDGKSLHVYERYKDVAATTAHLGTFATYAERFMAAVDLKRFVVFSELTPELKEAVAGLSPIYMSRIGGFAR